MGIRANILVIYENGVFRPETPVDLPERSRHRISIDDHNGNGSPSGSSNSQTLKDTLTTLRARGLIRTGGWRPTRDQLHERR